MGPRLLDARGKKKIFSWALFFWVINIIFKELVGGTELENCLD